MGNSEVFIADKKDGFFALAAFVLGFFFIRWVFFHWQGWGVSLFTYAYCGAVAAYIYIKGLKLTPYSWFWLAAVLLIGSSYSLWSNNGLEPWRSFFFFMSAVYWVIAATGQAIQGRTGDWLILDAFNALFVIPFRNFTTQYQSLAILEAIRKPERGQVFSIILGLILAFIAGILVLPLLIAADGGAFSQVAQGLLDYLRNVPETFWEYFVNVVLAIPVAAYLFGLVGGCVYRRGTSTFKEEGVRGLLSSLRFLPPASVNILLGFLCILYLIFTGSQVPYFFSAFSGRLPEGWQVYSEYARRGFFELCGIVAINLSILTLANILSRKPRRESKILRLFNSLLAGLTIVLIAAALSKMLMYIDVYGMTVRRLLPSLFMLYLLVICAAVIALQRWQFSIMRLAAGLGMTILCALCLIGPDSYAARYNAGRYLAGTLPNYDTAVLYQAGPAGVDAALQVYEGTSDPALKEQLQAYLSHQRHSTVNSAGRSWDSFQNARARQKLANFNDTIKGLSH